MQTRETADELDKLRLENKQTRSSTTLAQIFERLTYPYLNQFLSTLVPHVKVS